MARTANMSTLGLFTWDNTLFSLMVIPEGMDKDTLVDNILAETAELEVLYSNPTVLKNLIGVWSKKNLDMWTKMFETTQYEYNPIDNYNRIEEGTDSGTGSSTHGGTDTRTLGGTDTNGNTKTKSGSNSTSGSATNGHWVAGFDSSPSGGSDGLVKQTRDEGNRSETTTQRETETDNGSYTYGKTDTLRHGETVENKNNNIHFLHAHGNIGVTTTQKLIKEERQIDRFNPYDMIIEDYKMRFCILVY